MVYLVTYDLKAPGRDYSGLHAAIKACGVSRHDMESAWLIDTRLGADEIWSRLRPYVDANDRLLVIGVTRDFSGWLPKDAWDWLRDRTKLAA